MNSNRLIFWNFLILMLAQILMNNMMDLGLYAKVLIYPLFILNFPVTGNTPLLLAIAFATGLPVDLMSLDMSGLYTASILPVVLMRPYLYRLTCSKTSMYYENDPMDNYIPYSNLIPYYISGILVFELIYFGLETVFGSGTAGMFLLRTLVSSLINIPLVLLLALYVFKR